jgi:hypothetical protein
MLVTSFFENVGTHRDGKRALAPRGDETKTLLHFNPNPLFEGIVARLWSHWHGCEEPDLLPFATVTDEPPASDRRDGT